MIAPIAIDKLARLYRSQIRSINSSINGATKPPKTKAIMSEGNIFSFTVGSIIIPASISKVVIKTPKIINNSQLKIKRNIHPITLFMIESVCSNVLEGYK